MSRPLIAGRISPHPGCWEITLETYINGRLYRDTTWRASPSTSDWALTHFRKQERLNLEGAMVEALREFADYIDGYRRVENSLDSFDSCWRE